MRLGAAVGLNNDLKILRDEEEEAAEGSGRGGEEVAASAKLKFDYALSMCAVRWTAEIMAEKCCILCAGVIAAIYFKEDEEEGNSGNESQVVVKAKLCLVFFIMELVTDSFLVHILHNYMDVPMLSAVPRQRLLTAENLVVAMITGFVSITTTTCIGMASKVPVDLFGV
jgi:hypothetical protein